MHVFMFLVSAGGIARVGAVDLAALSRRSAEIPVGERLPDGLLADLVATVPQGVGLTLTMNETCVSENAPRCHVNRRAERRQESLSIEEEKGRREHFDWAGNSLSLSSHALLVLENLVYRFGL